MRRPIFISALMISLCWTLTMPGHARDFRGEGIVDLKVVNTESPDDNGVVKMTLEGPLTEKSGDMEFGDLTLTCLAEVEEIDAGLPVKGWGNCGPKGASEDVWTALFAYDNGEGKWQILAGTDKFETLRGNGTIRKVPSPDENVLRISWTGALSLD